MATELTKQGNVSTDMLPLLMWKAEMLKIIKMKHPNINENKVIKKLDSEIQKKCRNPKVVLFNNYTETQVSTDILSVLSFVEETQTIIGGEGCLFKQHSKDPKKIHVLNKFIAHLKDERDRLKNLRKKEEKGSKMWMVYELGQNNKKIKTNTLYGAMGCKSFFLFNKYLAMAITNCGRQIICTASLAFESFLGVEVYYNYEGEIFNHIIRVTDEIKEKFENGIDCSPFYIPNVKSEVKKKILNHCKFNTTVEFINTLDDILDCLDEDTLTILYYKSNLMKFCHTKPIMKKLKDIMNGINQLRRPSYEDIEEPMIAEEVKDFVSLCEVFVMESKPVFDRVRRTMFTNRDKVLYTDTDSTFLALNDWVTFIKDEVLQNYYHIEEMEMNFIAVNVMALTLNTVIHSALMELCYGMNTSPEWAALLTMKNEFYLACIVFTNAKKRYISDSVTQEGVLLRDKRTGVIGYPEIKGFDFKKAVVKPFVTEYFTNLSIDYILRADNIRVDLIYEKIQELKRDIIDAIRHDSRDYYKQAKVQLMESYATPLRLQSVRAVLLWNCLFEDMKLELPVDVDIVPIKTMNNKKNRDWLMNKYPELYEKMDRMFFSSPNEEYRKIELKVIARPKTDIQLPDWFYDIMDTEKIVSDIASLFYPIMESLGMNILSSSKGTQLSNLIDM